MRAVNEPPGITPELLREFQNSVRDLLRLARELSAAFGIHSSRSTTCLDDVLTALGAAGEGMTTTQIARATGRDPGAVRGAIYDKRNRGLFKRVVNGNRRTWELSQLGKKP